MLATHQTPFDLFVFEFPKWKGSKTLSFLSDATTQYIKICVLYYKANKYLKYILDNFEMFVSLNNLKSVEDADKILINLEEISEQVEETLKTQLLNKWLLSPIRYMLNKLLDNIYSLQGLLTAVQADLLKS